MNLFCAHSQMIRRQRPIVGGVGVESGVECFRCHAFFAFAHAGEKKSKLAAKLNANQKAARAARKPKQGRKIHHQVLDVRTARAQFVEFSRSGTHG